MSQSQRIRMVLRLASLVLSLFFAVNALQGLLSGNLHPINLPFNIALVAVAVACIAAWRWERAGGTAVIVCGLAVGLSASLTIFVAAAYIGADLRVQALAALIWAVPFIIFGMLFRALSKHEAKTAYGS